MIAPELPSAVAHGPSRTRTWSLAAGWADERKSASPASLAAKRPGAASLVEDLLQQPDGAVGRLGAGAERTAKRTAWSGTLCCAVDAEIF